MVYIIRIQKPITNEFISRQGRARRSLLCGLPVAPNCILRVERTQTKW